MFESIELNWLAIGVSVVASFGLMMVWYSKFAFGETWMKLNGKKEKDCKPSIQDFAFEAASTAIAVITLSIVLQWAGASSWMDGAKIGFLMALGFTCTSVFSGFIWAKHPFKLVLIDMGAVLVAGIVTGAILAGFPLPEPDTLVIPVERMPLE